MTKSEREKRTKEAVFELRQACNALAAGRVVNLPICKDVRTKAEIVIHLLESNEEPITLDLV